MCSASRDIDACPELLLADLRLRRVPKKASKQLHHRHNRPRRRNPTSTWACAYAPCLTLAREKKEEFTALEEKKKRRLIAKHVITTNDAPIPAAVFAWDTSPQTPSSAGLVVIPHPCSTRFQTLAGSTVGCSPWSAAHGNRSLRWRDVVGGVGRSYSFGEDIEDLEAAGGWWHCGSEGRLVHWPATWALRGMKIPKAQGWRDRWSIRHTWVSRQEWISPSWKVPWAAAHRCWEGCSHLTTSAIVSAAA